MKINGDDDDDDDHVFVSINSTRVELNIESDNIWDSLKLLGFDDVTTTVGHINMEEENDDNDDDHSLLSDMEESDVILETPPFSDDDDDDDSDEDLYLTSPLLPVVVHTPDVSDAE
jgi:hypothetical protein